MKQKYEKVACYKCGIDVSRDFIVPKREKAYKSTCRSCWEKDNKRTSDWAFVFFVFIIMVFAIIIKILRSYR